MRKRKRMPKSLIAVLVGATAAVAVAVPAWATTEYVGGGTWAYGVNFGINRSEYWHPNNWHTSSVKSNGITSRSACTDPGLWSDAWRYAGVSGNKAYWNNAC
ncbi:hypothetical protein Q0Z83_043480 [Actinoplanes sichuanensis]|uniref:Lactococcin 972 family bacteriocin n=1 Tax=Actinoplanes sichuanensis TaxID=512349 RepID=A0ABW4AVS7_9ACTN|nr:lactococcin 972 family bacteriocin [Actinoplanes sichuanensis]BEL06157.1 hypothetical protein Q0Z83_043480 [Actinoplanes sichuanensis]